MLTTILLLLSSAVLFSAESASADIREFTIEQIEKLGAAIYAQDLAVANATDLLFEQNLDLNAIPMRGWVVSETKEETTVTFVAKYDDMYFGVFEVRQKKGKKKGEFKQIGKVKLEGELLAQFNARNLALSNIDAHCSNRYNTVVLRDPEKNGFIVYALAATTDVDTILVGGHYRFTITGSGDQIQQKDKLFNSCLALDKTPEGLPPGADLAAYYMTHIVSATPVETHVFLNLMHKKPFHVGTPDNIVWEINNGKISRVE